MSEYNPKVIEAKWQERWLKEGVFEIEDDLGKENIYILEEFPYPSGDGLHVGHAKIYTATDVLSRYYRMRGFNVLHPMGWDAFGLPAENTAIKQGIHPRELTERNIKRFKEQMMSLGLSYAWSREINTTDPEYYKWTQWIFLKLFKRGLAYEDTRPISWCPSCLTGLANEEVVDGKCERCGMEVVLKNIRQWMLKITEYADRLLTGLEGLDWPKPIVDLQKNWIGRSEGHKILFATEFGDIEVYTTRVDTIFGATYLVLAPEHGDLDKMLEKIDNVDEVKEYIESAKKKTEIQRQAEEKEKTGVELKGVVAINPATGKEIPIWVADYVLMGYGTGAIMAVPAHDQRDFEFANKFGLKVQLVITSPARPQGGEAPSPYQGEGKVINSGDFNGQGSMEAKRKIGEWLETKGKAKVDVQYKLRDWVFSRQRYWGEPIPVVHCQECGVVPVPEEQLPVELPEVEKYEPTGTGESPLALIDDWVNVDCPECGGESKRETNTMPQWAGSSWYWIRFLDPENKSEIAEEEIMREWLPVDTYFGGAEHAVLHLLYARFWNLVLYDEGVVSVEEPFVKRRTVGLVFGEGGVKMSKSKGNVVNPDDVVEQYGADTLRLYEMFMGPYSGAGEWNPGSIAGVNRFLKRVWRLVGNTTRHTTGTSSELEVRLQQAIKRVTESIEEVKFNTGVAAMMELLNEIEDVGEVSDDLLKTFVLLLSPYAPHMAEELWEKIGNRESLVFESWPKFDENILKSVQITIPIQVNGKVRGVLRVDAGLSQEEVDEEAKKIENVKKYLEEKSLNKVIYVPDKLINFVVS